MYNLLSEQLIRVRSVGGEEKEYSLPVTLAELAKKQIESFRGLAPHQEHAWHAFLVQLAAIALHRAGRNKPQEEAGEWTELLRNLTPEFHEDEPWSLVVEDLSKPAFMQPPVPEGELDHNWKTVETPDGIDILVTSKNHDIKSARIHNPDSDVWIFCLVNIQTMEGFSGRQNYGISRMNSGYGNRPCVSLVSGLYPGERFVRDLEILVKSRDRLIGDYPQYTDKNRVALLWLKAWDGQSSLPVEGLDPYFIEICRRIRLRVQNGDIIARKIGTASPRLAGRDLKGNTGDPWTPVRRDRAAALTVGARGFHYTLLRQLFFEGGYKPGICQEFSGRDSGKINIYLQAMTRGMGKTEGYHERRIPLTKKSRNLLRLESGRNRLAEVSEKMVDEAGIMRKSILKTSLLALLQGGPEKINYKDGRADAWTSEFDRRVDALFFPMLWKSMEIDDEEESELLWLRRLVEMGRDLLCEAERSLPIPAARRYRALAAAERIFEGSVYNKFPRLKNKGKAA